MIRVSVMYPRNEGVTFDMDYYTNTHMAIVDRMMKPTRWEVDRGVDGPYIAMVHLFCESMDAMGAALGEAGEATADVANFTNAEPAFQISEVVS